MKGFLQSFVVFAVALAPLLLVTAIDATPECVDVNYATEGSTTWLSLGVLNIDNDDATMKTASGSLTVLSSTTSKGGGINCDVKVIFGEDQLDQSITCDSDVTSKTQFKVSYGTGTEILREFMLTTANDGKCSSHGEDFNLDATRLKFVTVSQANVPAMVKVKVEPTIEPVSADSAINLE